MDFILKKLNSKIAVSDDHTVEKQTLLRERIEYIFYLVLGCLWNEQKNDIELMLDSSAVQNLYKMSIGQVVSLIRSLDPDQKYITKKELKIFDTYPSLRNQAFGHGYVHPDMEPVLEEQLEALYHSLMEASFLKWNYNLISVTKKVGNNYVGFRFDCDSAGLPERWECSAEVFGEMPCPCVLLLDHNRNYYRVTPFVAIEDQGDSVYVFQSLTDKLSGNVKMCPLFKGTPKDFYFPELVSLSFESDLRRISPNRTIMNYFHTNYRKYIETPLDHKIEQFLSPKSLSNVQATVWGHGGVGKTACIQNICLKKFNDLNGDFAYIIFTSAKARSYNPLTEKIEEVSSLRTYQEIIDIVIAVLFDEQSDDPIEKKEERIYEITSRVLIVIDDYETFPDEEKAKIQSFISHLNVNYFKVIITTRNRRLSTGEEIPSNEFKGEETEMFLLSIFKNEHPNFLKDVKTKLKEPGFCEILQKSTAGHAIFLYQFAHLCVQTGFDTNMLQGIKDSSVAQEFLYGQIYTYLSDAAKKAFVCISQISDEKDLIFREHILEFLLKDYVEDVSSALTDELVAQKIIEVYNEENYRVYTKELLALMKKHYEAESQQFKDRIQQRLHDIGGKNITGTIYEAMLAKANQSRNLGNMKKVTEDYKHLLNEAECPPSVKKTALINLTSYLSINVMDLEASIQVFEEYIDDCNFRNDVDVIKLYSQYLWRSDESGKKKACDVLQHFFRNKKNKKTSPANLELFAMATAYGSGYALEFATDKETQNFGFRMLNEYGRTLYNYIVKRNFHELKPSEKHNVSIALVQTAKLILKLGKYDKFAEYVQGIIDFGEANFNELFLNQIKSLKTKVNNAPKVPKAPAKAAPAPATKPATVDTDTKPSSKDSASPADNSAPTEYKIGDMVTCYVDYIHPGGNFVLVFIDKKIKSVIWKSEITPEMMANLQKNTKLTAKVVDKNEKGYELTILNIPQD